MSGFTVTKPKGKLHCNSCQKTISAKDGDWFEDASSSGKQIFLCKPCEASHKATHKRPGSKS